MYLKLAWRNIWRNKRRTGIAIAAIFIAVIFAIGMRSMQLGSYDRIINNVVRFYTGYIQIHKKGFWDEQSLEKSMVYVDSLSEKSLSHKYLEVLIPRLESFALASKEQNTRGIQVVGVDPEKEKLLTNLPQKLTAGKYFKMDDRSMLITSDLANYLEAGVGDTVVLIGMGFHGANAAGKYPVAGIVKFNNPDLNKRLLFLPLKEAQWLFAADNRITSLIAMTQPDEVNVLTSFFRSRLSDYYEVMNWRQLIPEIVQAIELDNVGGIIILCILYIIIGFGIFGTIIMMTNERRHEFGVLVGLGMRRGRLLSILSLESIMMAFVGVLAGTAISLPIITYLHFHPIPLSQDLSQVAESYGMEAILPFSLAPNIFIYQAITVLIIALFAMAYPLFRILNLEPTEAMRS